MLRFGGAKDAAKLAVALADVSAITMMCNAERAVLHWERARHLPVGKICLEVIRWITLNWKDLPEALHAAREGLSFALLMPIMAAVPIISKRANHVSFLVWIAVYSKRRVFVCGCISYSSSSQFWLHHMPSPPGWGQPFVYTTPRTSLGDAPDVHTLFAQHAGVCREFCKRAR